MSKIEFSSVEELYQKVLPVLRIKVRELAKEEVVLSEKNLWTFLSFSYFRKEKYLTLADVVDRILKVEGKEVKEYLDYK